MDNWVKLSVRYYADPSVEGLPDADAEVMFTRGLARAGELQREGFIPADSLPKLARRRRYAASVEALLAAGLWTAVPGGYQVTNWDHWQDSLDALAKRRTSDRERKRASRAAGREALVRRYGDRCRQCGSTENIVVDHIVPRARGGSDDFENKQLLCWSCNARKRNLSDDEYAAWLAERCHPPVNPTPPNKRKIGVNLSRRSMSADVSADVTATEGEGDEELTGGTAKSYEWLSRDEEPPFRCEKHVKNSKPPACGGCADARKTHNRWQIERTKRLVNAPRCVLHKSELADNCATCRSEELAPP